VSGRRSVEWFAKRWHISPEMAQELLDDFERRGLVVRVNGEWHPTDRAIRHLGWLGDSDLDAIARDELDEVGEASL
jgi:hypothetical protein